jgi:branched-chain amino acid aminotransferase
VDNPLVYVGGELVPQSDARITVLDHGFLYGDAVFEGISIDGGRIFKLDEHIHRLFRSAAYLRIVPPVDIDGIRELVIRVVSANQLRDGYVRPILTRGTGPMGLGATRNIVTGNLVIIPQVRARLTDDERLVKGLHAKVVGTRRTPPECVDPRVKSTSYVNQILAKLEQWDAGADAAIMLGTDGLVAECAGENIFVVTSGVLRTPPHQYVLDGITRNTILELYARLGGVAREEPLSVYDLYTADEVFMTATLLEVAAITSVDGRRIGSGTGGPVTRQLLRELRTAMHEEGYPVPYPSDTSDVLATSVR